MSEKLEVPHAHVSGRCFCPVFEALDALVRQSGLSAVIATHNHHLASLMNRRVTLHDGKVVEM